MALRPAKRILASGYAASDATRTFRIDVVTDTRTLFTKKFPIGSALRTRWYAASVGSFGRNWGGTVISCSPGPLSDVRNIQANGNTVKTAIASRTAYQPALDAVRPQRIRRTVRGRGARRATGFSMAVVSVAALMPRRPRARGSAH